jgi:oxygen-independent coproporphyrinogen-3 oxidase
MIDFNKFTKYSKPGPRYTSYPTAVEFNENFDEKVYIKKLKEQDSTRPLSLYFHLPFCRSACYFCGCNVVYTSKEDKKERYITYLEKELEILSKYLDMSRTVTQMHFGGGTPTFFDDKQLEQIIVLIKRYFPNFSSSAEISCEIDPRFLTENQMKVLSSGGFNRVSFGVQDFDEKVQKAVHRVQNFELTKNVVNLAKQYGMKSINVDLIYGLPFQNLKTFTHTLDLVKSLDVNRVAVFNYAHVPWLMKTMRKIDETTLPSPKEKLEILKYTINFFEQNHYKMIGMDHFAKEDDELFKAIEKNELHRNFQGYTTKGGADLIGIGLTSIGEGVDYYVQNHKDMKLYEKALDEGKLPAFRGIQLTPDDIIRQDVIMQLMSNFKLDIPKIEQTHNITFNNYFPNAINNLQEFIKEDLVTFDGKLLQASSTGGMLIRNIAMAFDAYLQKIPQEKRVFSKTV